ncbi:MAG: hypothetical protein QOI71_1747 [Gaiellales bacterium]|jgi:uncharacterized RDD family membrane protein YckC|nr:hypothetical protein [Gaiellales bacterium]
MTDDSESAVPQTTVPGPAPAPVRARALAGLIDLVPCDITLGLLAWRFEGAGIFVGVLISAIVLCTFEARTGQTPGKRLTGLEVRYLDGTPCDLRAAIIRNVFRFLDWFPGIYLIGGFAIAGNRRRQRLGDQAAGTSVYRRSELVTWGAGA